MGADRNLLFGVLALEMDLITRDQLVAAMGAWVLEKSRPLGEILVDRGDLKAADRALLEPLVDRHVQAHGDDPTKSLAAITSLDPGAADALGGLIDPELRASLAVVTRATVAGATISLGSAGQATTDGGRFVLLRPHARGGLGQVYVARDAELDRQVALKEILGHRADDPVSRARFVREAEITGKLEHPGVVPVYGLGRHADGRPYYAMRFIRGDSLKDAIKRFHADGDRRAGREVAFRALLARFLDVCDAMAYAHSRGVLHRDLKPENVMLGPFGETLVVDWGLAKAAGADSVAEGVEAVTLSTASGSMDETLAGAALGTPAFMSPEQAEGKVDTLGPATDVYGLGAILYSLLTGHSPVESDDLGETLARVIKGDVPTPRSHDGSIPRPLEAVCRKALALRPVDRYATPRELAADLQAWLAGEPVSAWPEPWRVRAGRWARRHRTAVTAVAAASLVGLLALVGYGAQRVAAANGRVEALPGTEIAAVPRLLADLGGDRRLVRPGLRAMAAEGRPDSDRLRGALALLPDEPAQGEYLIGRMLDPATTPDELLVIRRSLLERGLLSPVPKAILAQLQTGAAALSDRQLRALGAVATTVKGGWADWSPLMAAKLATENPLFLGDWREVFQPLALNLIEPLRAIYADRTNAEARDRAFTLLYEFATRPENPRGPEDLAALLIEADPPRLERILGRLATSEDQGRAVAVLEPLLLPVAKFDDALAERQGRVGAALIRLNRPEPVWPLFAFRDDPSTRTELIHQLDPSGVDPKLVIERLRMEIDVSARRALILALGEFPVEAIPATERRIESSRQGSASESPPALESGISDLESRSCPRPV